MATSESLAGGEALVPKPEFDLMLARHAEYHMEGSIGSTGNYKGDIQEARPEDLGHLTETGKEQAKELGARALQRAIDMGGDVDVTFIASTQPYESPKHPELPGAGVRAEETADSALMEMLQHEDVLSKNGIRILSPLHEQAPETPYNQRLVEPNVYWIPVNREGQTNPNPRAYMEAQKEKWGPAGRKEGFMRGDAEVDRVGEEIGAETSADTAKRAKGVLEDMAELARLHAEREPGRKLLVVLVTHDTVVRSTLQNQLGAGEAAHDWLPGLGESVSSHVENGQITTEFQGKQYQVEF